MNSIIHYQIAMLNYLISIFKVIPPVLRVKLMILVLISTIISLGEGFALSLIFQKLTQWSVGQTNDFEYLGYQISPGRFIFIVVCILFLVATLRLITIFFNLYFANQLNRDLSIQAYQAIRAAGYPFLTSSTDSNELASTLSIRVSAIGSKGVFQVMMIVSNGIILAFILALGVITFSEYTNLALAVVFFIFAAMFILSSRFHKQLSDSINLGLGRAFSSVLDLVNKAKDIYAFNASENFERRFCKAQGQLATARTIANFVGSSSRQISEVVLFAILIGILILDQELITEHIDGLGMALITLQRVLPYFQGMFAGWTALNTSQGEVSQAISLYAQMEKLSADYPNRSHQVLKSRRISRREIVRFDSVLIRPSAVSMISVPDFCIFKGEWLGISAESGRGKSTLLDVISQIRPVYSGKVTFFVSDSRERLRSGPNLVAYVPQSPILFGETLLDALTQKTKISESEHLYLEFLFEKAGVDFVTTADIVKPFRQYSGGQVKRLALVRALFQKPELLLLDEFSAGLSKNLGAQILAYLKSTAIACVLVSHNNSDFDFCERVIKLDE